MSKEINSDNQAVFSAKDQPGRGRMLSLLLVDDELGLLRLLQRGLDKHFGMIEIAPDTETAEELRQRCHFDLIITDIRLAGPRSGIEWVSELRKQGVATVVIFMTAYADFETALSIMRVGASDLIMKPFQMEQIIAAVDRCFQGRHIKRENLGLRSQLDQQFDDSGIIGNCSAILDLCRLIKRIAPMPSTVLIEGESGTGKELAARAFHKWSGRSGAFVPVNCGAISAELLESELFGHVKGAYTGAHQARVGLFAYANQGSLFLDEIGEMPLSMQAHLLRVLEDRKIRQIGSNSLVPVDVRIIAATNRPLADEVEKGKFRRDLYYRLNVLSIHMPSLRDRTEDVVPLAQHFARTLSRDMGVATPEYSGQEVRNLQAYNWPGNVRELKNVIERSLLLNVSPTSCIVGTPGIPLTRETVKTKSELSTPILLEDVEKQHILKILQQKDGNKSAAAKILGVSRKTLERKTKKWEINA